jgi:TldD protein
MEGTPKRGAFVLLPALRYARLVRELCGEAIDAATAGGAGYADARAVTRRAQHVATKNGEVESVSDGETEGVGVRVLVDGAWGFACDRRLTEEGARAAAERAVAFARASAGRAGRRQVELAPAPAEKGEYRTPAERDPVDVPLSAKVELCLRAEGAMQHDDVKITEATLRAQREERAFQSSEGADVYQVFVECGGGIDALAIRDGKVQIRSYPSAHGGSSSQSGWEYVEGLDLPGNAPRVGEEASALLRADPCPSGVTTVVLDSEQMVLQVHESVGHPTELDRVYGTEAAYAGTSFLKPGDLGSLRYGSDLMNITADSTTAGGLGTFAYDDEGVPAGR